MIDGITKGIANAESYDSAKETLFTQIGNFLEGRVDDYVRENADFHHQAGLSPMIRRTASAKCCTWCDALVGDYPYEDVSDRGNDVFRRHKNCHCTVAYDPRDGSKNVQNVHTRQWTNEKPESIMEYKERKRSLTPVEKGKLEAVMFSDNWQKASLKETLSQYAPDAERVASNDGRKVFYRGPRYTVIYDREGNYYRIKDKTFDGRVFVDLLGNRVLNITENGKRRGATNEEYEMMTHFLNIDQ